MNMDQFVNQNDNLVDWAFLLIAVCLIGLAFYVTASSTSYIGVKFCDYICKTACLQLQSMQANTLENFLSHQTIRRISFCASEPGTGHMPVVQQKACICLGGNDTTDISITSMTNVTIYLIFLPMLLRCGGNASCSKCYKRKRKFTRSEMDDESFYLYYFAFDFAFYQNSHLFY